MPVAATRGAGRYAVAMSLSTLPALLSAAAAETEELSDPAVPAWVIGLLALGILLALLIGLVAFGGGREHS